MKTNTQIIRTKAGLSTVAAMTLCLFAALNGRGASASWSSSAPSPGANDIYQTSTTGNNSGGLSGSGVNYYSNAGYPPGEAFTTGSHFGGYNMTDIYIKSQASSGQTGGGFSKTTPWTLYVYSVSGTTATLIASYSSLTPSGTFTAGNWLHFSSLSVPLAAGTAYAFTVSTSSGYTGLENSSTAISGGSAGSAVCINPSSPFTVYTATYSGGGSANAVFDIALTPVPGINLSEQSGAPTPGTYDISQMSNTGNVNKPGGNTINYYSNNNPAPGETFTTGSYAGGYTMTDIYVQSQSNSGQYGNGIGGATPLTLYIYSISGSTATLLTSYTGATGSTYNSGDWFHFSGMTIGLAPNTTYAYAISSGGNPYTGLENSTATLSGASAALIVNNGGAVTAATGGANGVFDIVLNQNTTTVSQQSSAPTPGANDISQLSITGSGSSPGGNSGYYSNNGLTPPGEQFTMANNAFATSYTLTNVSIMTGTGAGSGWGNNIGALTPWTLYIYSVSGGTATQIAAYSGITGASFTGGDWIQFSGLSLSLSKNTVYAYAISSSFSGSGAYTLLENSTTGLSGANAALIANNSGAITTLSGANGVFDLGISVNYVTPTAPTIGTATAGNNSVTVTWTAPGSGPTPTGYNVKRSTVSGSETTLPAGTNVAASPFIDNTAVNGQTYFYEVSALNYTAESANSGEVSATPAVPPITATASATPANVNRYQNTVLSVTPASGTPPYVVTMDASPIGGASTLSLISDGAGDYTNTVAVSSSTTLGTQTLLYTVTDSSSPPLTNTFALTILTVTASSLVWDDRANNHNWDLADQNWTNPYAGTLDYYLNNEPVTFNDSLLGSGSVILNGTLTPSSLTVSNSTATYTFSGSGQISGGTALVKQGTGTLTLSESGGDNFSGGLTVSNGTVILDNSSSAITGSTFIGGSSTVQVGNNDANGNLPSATITNNGTLILDRSDTALSVGTAISGSGTVINSGSGTVTLSANNPLSGGILVNNGLLKVTSIGGGNSALGTGNTEVNTNGTLIGTSSDAFGYSNQSGNHAPGTIVINGGTVSNLPSSSYRITLPNLNFTGGTLATAAGNAGDANGNYSLLGNGSGACTVMVNATNTPATIGAAISLQTPTTFNVGLGTVPGGVDLLVSSPIVPYGSQPLIKTGAGTMTLSAANTYTGSTTVSNGTLAITGSGSLGSGSYAGSITNNGTFYYDSSAAQTLSGLISGSGGILIKDNTSSLVLSTANTFTGSIIVSNGQLRANNVNAFNSQPITVTANGGQIYLAANGTFGSTCSIIGYGQTESDGISHMGAIRLATAGANLSGTITLTGDAGIGARGTGSGGGIVSGQITGPYNLRLGRVAFTTGTSFGTLILSNTTINPNNWTGNTTNMDGTLKLGAADQIPSGSGYGSFIMSTPGAAYVTSGNPITNTVFDLNGYNQTINGLFSDPNVTGTDLNLLLITNSSATAATLMVGSADASGSYAGIIGDNGAGSLAFTKIGAGAQTLIGANTYTGNTTVSAGTLLVNGSLASGSAVTVNGGLLGGTGTINGSTTVNSGAYLAAGVGGIGTLTVNNSLTLNGASTNWFVVTTADGASNQVVVASGTLTPNGSIIEINTAGDANLGVGTNVLFTYSGISGSFTATPVFDTVQTGAATNAVIVDNGSGNIELVVTNPASAPLPSSDASLIYLALSPLGTLAPAFDPGTTNYAATNANADTLVTVTVTNTSAYATNVLFLNGVAQGSPVAGSLAASVPVGVGSTNVIEVQVTAQDGLTTSNYFVTVTRLGSTNALLSNLVITPAGTLSPAFTSGTTSYNATNTWPTNGVTVTATSADGTAVLALSFNNGSTYNIPLTNGVASGTNAMSLTSPANVAAVQVVSQDLSQTNVYTVNVLLQPSATMPKLTNSVSGNNLVLSWPADHLGYRLLVQTNNLNKGVSGNINDWGTVAGSQSITATNIAIIKSGVTNQYYKLVYP
jgi:autotransporter-associated beta strand protein